MVDNTRKPRDVASWPHHGGSAAVDAKVGSNIRGFRNALNVPLRLLALEAGVSETALSDYEQGLARPGADELFAIATSLGVEISDLFAGI